MDLHVPPARIHSRPLKFSAHTYAICSLLFVSTIPVRSQPDTTAIGGPEVLTPYGDEDPEELTETLSEDVLPTELDSARFIPSYDLYGDFDTHVIFERMDLAGKDSTVLQLSTTPCDHVFPVCGQLNSPFGPRHRRMHYGVDIDLERGDPVVSAFEGVVRVSRYHRQFGNVVVVRHANGLETLYGHLSERRVKPGDHVEAGDLIGLGGSTGRSTGDHLHFETRYLGRPIDPQMLFDVREGELRTKVLNVHQGLFATPSPSTGVGSQGTYIVRRGDTLSAIARRKRTTVSSLCRKNRISSRSTLRVGQRLRY